MFNQNTSEDYNCFTPSYQKFSFYSEQSVDANSSVKIDVDTEDVGVGSTVVKHIGVGENAAGSHLRTLHKDVVQYQSMSEFGENIVKYVCSDEPETETETMSETDNYDTDIATIGFVSASTLNEFNGKSSTANSPIEEISSSSTHMVGVEEKHYMLPSEQILVSGNNLMQGSILLNLRDVSEISVRKCGKVCSINENLVEPVFENARTSDEYDSESRFCLYLDSSEVFATQNRSEDFKTTLVSNASCVIGHIHQCLSNLETTYCKLQIYDAMKIYVCGAREQLNEMQNDLNTQLTCKAHTNNSAKKHPQHTQSSPQRGFCTETRKQHGYQYSTSSKTTRPRKSCYTLGNNKGSKASAEKVPSFVPKARGKPNASHTFQKFAPNSKAKQSHVRANRKCSQERIIGSTANPASESYCDSEETHDDGMIPTTIVSPRDEQSISSVSYSNMCITPVPCPDVHSAEDFDTIVKKKYLKTGTHFVPGRKSQHNSHYVSANRVGHLLGFTRLPTNEETAPRRSRRDFSWKEAQAKAEEKLKHSVTLTGAEEDGNSAAKTRGENTENANKNEFKESRSITKKNLKSVTSRGARQQHHLSPRRPSFGGLENGSGDFPRTPARGWLTQKSGCNSIRRSKRRGINQEEMQKLESILTCIWNMKESEFIITYEVSEEVPMYRYTNPMNLKEIASKLRRKVYETVEQLVHDFRRMLLNVRLHYEDGEDKDIFYEHSFTLGRRFDNLLLDNFHGCDFSQITGDPDELRSSDVLRYRAWDVDSE
ncbi:uncharacterized protein LOC134543090 isoform X1 [Bacillus rossius redtenbacheri]